MNIGLTGGIATGKSTVSAMLRRLGAVLIDADLISREVVLPGTDALAKIVAQFGQAILRGDGSLDRKKLGAIVFSDENKRKQLEAIVHPVIRTVMRDRMKSAQSEHPERLVVVDVPLLYESGLERFFQQVMVVYIPEHEQIARLMARDKLSRIQAAERIKAQLPIEEKRQRAHIVINNSGSFQETERQIEQFWHGMGLE